ncbi:MAG TPA: hypothetical protein VK348_07025 [Planctomycetota bacterium]|nr:hypothetical protein [Planctomycetota bacterium]
MVSAGANTVMRAFATGDPEPARLAVPATAAAGAAASVTVIPPVPYQCSEIGRPIACSWNVIAASAGCSGTDRKPVPSAPTATAVLSSTDTSNAQPGAKPKDAGTVQGSGVPFQMVREKPNSSACGADGAAELRWNSSVPPGTGEP